MPHNSGQYLVNKSDYNFGEFVLQPQEGVFEPLTVRLKGSLSWPKNIPGNKAPLVILAHGRHSAATENFRGLEYIGNHLSSHGMICASVDLNDLVGPQGSRVSKKPSIVTGGAIIHRAKTILKTIAELQSHPVLGSIIDFKNVGLIGHSRGGEAVCRAAALSDEAGRRFGISGVFSIAPVDFGSVFMATPLFLLYGDLDADVSDGQSLRIWDRARGLKRGYYVKGAIHNFFSRNWENEWRGTPHPSTLSRNDHEKIAKSLTTAFFYKTLLKSDRFLDVSDGLKKNPLGSSIHMDPLVSNSNSIILDEYSGVFDPSTSSIGEPVQFFGDIEAREMDIERHKVNAQRVSEQLQRHQIFHDYLDQMLTNEDEKYVRAELKSISLSLANTLRYLQNSGELLETTEILTLTNTILGVTDSKVDWQKFQKHLEKHKLSSNRLQEFRQLVDRQETPKHGLNHIGKGLRVTWNKNDAVIEYRISKIHFSLSSYISFRCTQLYDSSGHPINNQLNQELDFSISVYDSKGDRASIKLSELAQTIPSPTLQQHTFKAALVTRLIPIKKLLNHEPGIEIDKLSTLRFEFDSSVSGAVVIDDLAVASFDKVYKEEQTYA